MKRKKDIEWNNKEKITIRREEIEKWIQMKEDEIIWNDYENTK
jgi:hypothetical protein